VEKGEADSDSAVLFQYTMVFGAILSSAPDGPGL